MNFARHQHNTERTQNIAGRSRSQLFRHFCGSSVRRNKQRGSTVKFPVQPVLEPYKSHNGPIMISWTLTFNSNTHRITQYHVSPRGQESKCHVDVSQRELGRTKPTLGTCKNEQHIVIGPPKNKKHGLTSFKTRFSAKCSGANRLTCIHCERR